MISAIRYKSTSEIWYRRGKKTGSPHLVDLVTTVLLKVASDVAQERDIKKGGRNQKQEGTSKDKDSEKGRECEGRGDDSIAPEVLGEVVPFTPVILLGHGRQHTTSER
jgi:hypothetical protein